MLGVWQKACREHRYQNPPVSPLHALLRLTVAMQVAQPPSAALEESGGSLVSFSCINTWSSFGILELFHFPPSQPVAAVKLCFHRELLPCGGKGAGRYPLKNVNSCSVVRRFPRSAKPWQVQEFTGEPGRQRGVPAATRETASQAGCCGKHLEMEAGKAALVAPPALPVSRELLSTSVRMAKGQGAPSSCGQGASSLPQRGERLSSSQPKSFLWPNSLWRLAGAASWKK